MADSRETTPLERLLGHPGQSPAISEPTGYVTYASLAARSADVARRLLDGRRSLAGSRVAMLMRPGAPFVATLAGIWRAGGSAVPLSALHTPSELGHMLAVAAPEATVVDSAEKWDNLVAVSGAERLGRRLDADAAYAERFPLIAGERVAPDLASHREAVLLFTSGTTGRPKGVRLSHRAVAATLDSLCGAWRWSGDDRLLHALPLYHTHGLLVALLGALWAGAAVQFTSPDAGLVWDALGSVTVFMAVPTIYVRLVDAFHAADPERRSRWARGAGGLRLATSGSAALATGVHAAFAEVCGQTILERYGMTEIGMALSNPFDGPRVPGTVGVPLPGVSVDIVGADDLPLPDGEAGELRVRSPQLFLGYDGDPEGTAASFDRVGRFRTGDTGVRGADGYVRLLGRTSVDILKSGGYKLSALEIEEVLRGHPGVAEVAVIGVPDPVWGDCVTACVVPRAGAAPTIEDLREFARHTLAPYKLPQALRLLSALPRNPMGKVQKSLLR
jgi:malonyl-CoA/methylmalonyl-CoA synthetase